MALLVVFIIVILILLLLPKDIISIENKNRYTRFSETYVIEVNSPVVPKYRYVIEYSEDPVIRERQEFVFEQCERFGADPSEGLAIIPCEGNFRNPEICNREFGCSSGQGPWMFIESTWFSTISRMIKSKIDFPFKCKDGDQRGDFECNAIAGAWLLAKDGVVHWEEWSGRCWKQKLVK